MSLSFNEKMARSGSKWTLIGWPTLKPDSRMGNIKVYEYPVKGSTLPWSAVQWNEFGFVAAIPCSVGK